MPKRTAEHHAEDLAAPLDLLLVNSTRSFAERMMPNRSWTRLGVNLAKQPGTVARRVGSLTRELGTIAVGTSERAPARSDKRFSDSAWQDNPLLHRTMQAYLAMADTAETLFADADLDWRDAEKMRFVLDNFAEGLAPTNNPLVSPLGWKALINTGGLSALRGLRAFARDMASKPRVPAMVEPDAFAVGETVATTKGAVVLQTSVFELIQYAPQTPTVRSIPLLMVPPVINKYYIMDIAPGRSMIEYFVQQGQQVFVISWRNPQARHRDWGFDAYGAAIVEALDAVQKIAGADRAHMLATCSGGILAAMVAAHLAEIGEGDRIAGSDARGHRAGPGPGGLRRGGDERTRRQGRHQGVGGQGLPRRPCDGRSVRLAAPDRPDLAVLGEQLRPGPYTGAVRRAVLERRHHPHDRGVASRHGADGDEQLAQDAWCREHARDAGRPVADHRRFFHHRRYRRPYLPVAGHLSQRFAVGQQGQPLRPLVERSHRVNRQPSR